MNRVKDFTSFFLYILGFLLLWEWIRPLEQLTETSDSWVFVLFLVVCLTISFFQLHFTISALIKWLFILYFLHFFYFEGSIFQFGWIVLLLHELKENISILFTASLPEISNLFRTLLFFILMWLMGYLLQYWLISRRKIFIFYFMTLTYITVLDTFTPYDAGVAIVRAVIIGFATMGLLNFYRLLDQEQIAKEKSLSRKWMFPLSIMIIISVFIGFAMPKMGPIWPDPVPYIQSFNEENVDEGSGAGRVGYGTDDSRLGGPFLGDDTVVFRTEVESRHYWKVETKDVYTGKGWITSSEEAEMIPFNGGEDVPISSFVEGDQVKRTIQTSTVYPVRDYPHVLYPLGIKGIQAGLNHSFELDPTLEKIYSLDGSRPTVLSEYSLTYEVPKYSVSAMMSGSSNGLSDEFMAQYTQLPDTLPQRVRDLAVEITKDDNNWFDKARAVEQYFQGAGFIYDQQDVLIPDEDEDYVDQFLFESMRGYCDNFSTSMVVLLRSLDIPARWVKGYTEGQYKNFDSNKFLFEITNNNAHSWVEVYFPEVGWVPFEPTQTFNNSNQYNFDNSEQMQNPEINTPEMEEEQEVEEGKELETSDKQIFPITNIWNHVKEFTGNYWKRIVLTILGVGITIFYIYKKRVKWLPYFFIWRFKKLLKDESFIKAYILLLKQLDRYGLKRKEGQTLRDYAKEIDRFFATNEMSKMTARYEQYVYRNELKNGTWEETRELWENLIKRTIA